MAVYQISKIQIRRGKARSGPGFPQLSSGELGWALDTQELYIGNGSISEGAPTVGNTKILTSKDIVSGGSSLINILEHTYKSQDGTITTGPNSSFPVVRSLQVVLDDNVYTSSFGAVGDGTTDDTIALQRAINQLFANVNLKSFINTGVGTKRRVTLKIPAGIFVITSELLIPSYATIVGAGIDKTIIQYTGTGTAIRFISDVESTYPITRPRNISINSLTIHAIELATIGLDINNVSNSSFSNIKLIGNWTTGTPLSNKGISIVNTENTWFDNIVITKFFYGVYVGNAVTNINFNLGDISMTGYGIVSGIDLTGAETGAVNFQISNSKFDQISYNALLSNIGSSNSISNCSLTNVGGDNESPEIPQLYFINPNFSCSNIRSDRSAVLSGTSSLLPIYVPEVSGSGTYTSSTSTIDLIYTGSNPSVDILRLPLRTNQTGAISGSISYSINYVFTGVFNRQGTISIVVPEVSLLAMSEDYNCDTLSVYGSELDFTAAVVDNSVVLSYTNKLANNSGILTYSYTSLF